MDARRRRLVTGTLLSPIATRAASAGRSSPKAAPQRLLAVQIGHFAALATGVDPASEMVQLGQGMAACIARANAMGGVREQPLGFAQLPDRDDPAVFIERFRQAKEEGALAVLCPYGDARIKRLLDEQVLDSLGPAVVGAVPGSEVFRSPGHPKLLHVRAGDGQQITSMVRHARQLGIRRVAVLAVASDIGVSGIADVRTAAGSAGNMAVTALQAPPDPASLAAAAGTLAKGDFECAIVIGPAQFMAEAVQLLRAASFSQFIYALSYLSTQRLLTVAGDRATRVAISQVLPDPRDITLPLQREFRAAMQKHVPSAVLTSLQLEGYVCAKVFIEGLRRAQTLDGQSLAWALRTANELDLGGYPVDFSHGNGGSRYVDIAIVGKDGKLKY